MRIPAITATLLMTWVLLLTSPTSIGQTMNPENKDIELLRLEFEREKWRAETEMRARELALQEREQGNKDEDLVLRRNEQARSRWTNPLVVAVLAAALAALGNGVIAIINGKQQRALDINKHNAQLAIEESKAESVRILEMIKTGDAETAAKNLEFLLDTGLVAQASRAPRLREFLAQRPAGTGPALPAPSQFSFQPTAALTPSDVKVLTSRINARRLQYYVDRYSGKTDLDHLGRINSRHVRNPNMPRIVKALIEDFKTIPNNPFHISQHEFTHEGRLLHNIVAELEGQSNDQVLITASLDSTAASSRGGFDPVKDPAPGADDNGSGLAAVLVIAEAFAELFQERRPRMTVRFVLFNATQQGLVGSRIYVQEQARGNVNIVAVYHMQMIGFDGDKDGAFEVHAGYTDDPKVEQRSGWLAQRISAVRTQLSPRLSPQIYITDDPLLSMAPGDPVAGRSDHSRFQELGIPACVVTENFFPDQRLSTLKADANPNYHTALDTEVDYSYTADIARLVAGAAVLTVNSDPTKQFR